VQITPSIVKFRCLLIAIVLLPLLAGCASKPKPQNPEVNRSIEVVRLSQKLEASGARVIQTGQTMRILLSGDKLFNPHSANLTSVGSKTLNVLSQLMMQLETTSVQVSGYTDVEPTQLQNKALSTGQAQTVADYLWSKGVDARLLYSVGYGYADKTSAGMPGNFAKGTNRRVEVQFQYLPLLSSLVD